MLRTCYEYVPRQSCIAAERTKNCRFSGRTQRHSLLQNASSAQQRRQFVPQAFFHKFSSWLLRRLCRRTRFIVCTGLKINFMAMANTGRVKVKGRLIKHGMRSFQIRKFNNKKKLIFRSLLDRSNMIKNSKNWKKLIFEAQFKRWLITRKKLKATLGSNRNLLYSITAVTQRYRNLILHNLHERRTIHYCFDSCCFQTISVLPLIFLEIFFKFSCNNSQLSFHFCPVFRSNSSQVFWKFSQIFFHISIRFSYDCLTDFNYFGNSVR